GVDLGRDSAGDDLQNLLAEGDEQPVDARLDLGRGIARLRQGGVQRLLEQLPVGRHLGRLQEQRWIRGGIPRLVVGKRLEVTRVGDNYGDPAQLVEQIHRRLLRVEYLGD